MSDESETKKRLHPLHKAGIGAVMLGSVLGVRELRSSPPPGPFMGGVEITMEDGTPIAPENLTNEKIRSFLTSLIDKAHDAGMNLLSQSGISLSAGRVFDAETWYTGQQSTYERNINAAKRALVQRDYTSALGDIEDAIAAHPKVELGPDQHEAFQDTKELAKQVEDSKELLEKARRVLHYLVHSQGRDNKEQETAPAR